MQCKFSKCTKIKSACFIIIFAIETPKGLCIIRELCLPVRSMTIIVVIVLAVQNSDVNLVHYVRLRSSG